MNTQKFLNGLWLFIYVGLSIAFIFDPHPWWMTNVWAAFMAGLIILAFMQIDLLHCIRLAIVSLILAFVPLFFLTESERKAPNNPTHSAYTF